MYPCTGSSIRVTTLATASKRVSWPNPPISCAPKGRPEGPKSVGKEIDGKCSKVHRAPKRGSPEIGRAHVELQSLMRISYAVFCLKKKNEYKSKTNTHTDNDIS